MKSYSSPQQLAFLALLIVGMHEAGCGGKVIRGEPGNAGGSFGFGGTSGDAGSAGFGTAGFGTSGYGGVGTAGFGTAGFGTSGYAGAGIAGFGTSGYAGAGTAGFGAAAGKGGAGGVSGSAGKGGVGGVSGKGGSAGVSGAPCGNGQLDVGETCDDGNTVTETCAYGLTSCTVCDAKCQQKAGATSFCGDGKTDMAGGETCDDGNTVTETCPAGQMACMVCNSMCQLVPGAPTKCGDGFKDVAAGEECDDGNTVKWDGCSDTCKVNFLNIAVESLGVCPTGPQQILVDIVTRLNARGHTAKLVDATSLDTSAEINAYDVIVLGGYTANCNGGPTNDLGSFDPLIPAYLAAGHGIVAAGWYNYSPYPSTAPNIAAAIPQIANSDYMATPFTATPVGSHPIVAGQGFTSFSGGMDLACAGGTKSGATPLLTGTGRLQSSTISRTVDCGAAWKVNAVGRAAFLGPLYNESYSIYSNQSLLDGSQPSALNLYMRTIEWAGGWYE